MFTAQGPVSWTLEGSPRYRGGTVVQFTKVRLVALNIQGTILEYHELSQENH